MPVFERCAWLFQMFRVVRTGDNRCMVICCTFLEGCGWLLQLFGVLHVQGRNQQSSRSTAPLDQFFKTVLWRVKGVAWLLQSFSDFQCSAFRAKTEVCTNGPIFERCAALFRLWILPLMLQWRVSRGPFGPEGGGSSTAKNYTLPCEKLEVQYQVSKIS